MVSASLQVASRRVETSEHNDAGEGGLSARQDGTLLTLLARWHARNLCAMPDGHNPHESPLDPVEEPIRRHDHFAGRELREFRDDAAGAGKFLQSP